MELEYKDPSRRGRWIVLLGLVLALLAGAAAFFLINNAQQKAGMATMTTISGYVAAGPIPARKELSLDDLALRDDIPLDASNADLAITDPQLLVGRLLAVDVPRGQLLTTNLLASSTVGLGFSILGPDASVAPDAEAWRAVSVTVSDDRAVGGVLAAGMTVDVFVSATVSVPETAPDAGAVTAAARNNYYTDRSTKITYQGMQILSRSGTYYILRVPLVVAEEINHLQAEGTTLFSMALRPDEDTRVIDASRLGTTTNRVIERYGLPIPEYYPKPAGPIATNPPIPAVTQPPPPGTTPSAGSTAPPADPYKEPQG